MALSVLSVQSHYMCYNEKNLKSAISFEVEKGFLNAAGGNMRFSNFLQSKLLSLCSRSKHKIAHKLLEEVNGYGTASISDRSKLLNKVSVLMGYESVQDLVENERAHSQHFGSDFKDILDEFAFSLAQQRFPSIIIGSSSPILLYDEVASKSEGKNHILSHVRLPVGEEILDIERISKAGPSLDSPIVANPSFFEEKIDNLLPISPQCIASQNEEATVPNPVEEDSSLTSAHNLEQKATMIELILDKPLNNVPGISSKHRLQLENCGFHTLRKLLQHFPRTYADLHNAQSEVEDGNYMISIGKILSSRGIRASSSFSFLEVVVACDIGNNLNLNNVSTEAKKTIYLHLKKFFRGTRFTNQYFLKSIQAKHKEGDYVCVSGKVKAMKKEDHFEMREYHVDVIADEKESCGFGEERTYPLYPSKGGLKPDFIRDAISRALQALSVDIDPIPKEICEEFDLLNLYDAYVGIHHPKNLKEADLARKRLLFDEFFYLQLGRLFQMLEPLGTRVEREGLLDRYRTSNMNGVLIEDWSALTHKLLKSLPYSLTSSQLKAISEIIWDLKQPVPMYRLLQGDVGCGKTIVAFLACMEVIGLGYQAAFMVPTELLAIQHYEHLLSLLSHIEEPSRPSIALITGSTPARQSRITRKGLQDGEISLVIGTHSLIAESIEFSALRIAIIDEQHRFGVIQRGRFNSKLIYSSASLRKDEDTEGTPKTDMFMAPHVLAMSATPIPRTLAFALYGDMSLTQITDLPPGRQPIETSIFEGNYAGNETVYQMMRDELLSEGRIYIVYPIIETSEQLPQLRAASSDLETISKKFEGYQCGLLHGRMKADEKDEALRRFKSGETHILLSTQVVEIGVDVPDASMMVVMNAERFGIAQLHQLRGRVGRGMKKSKCIFLVSSVSGMNRLKVLEKSSDGFHLANIDLLIRGPGDLLGKKQSGHIPEFPIARLEMDGNMLEEAHHAALKLLGTSHDLERFPKLKAELSMRQPLCLLGD
ncbi:Atp-dependent dna helicase recg [Thalictrum thalictroides]|uniref:DNA 3'-5' helicase n=1 Tax=Thalictrum thalictroides TaxID=46969 RepID=A0A7J6V5C4_THATH|nr:Atp-dependent dna helicase recg [Thalictrum thalictroides]